MTLLTTSGGAWSAMQTDSKTHRVSDETLERVPFLAVYSHVAVAAPWMRGVLRQPPAEPARTRAIARPRVSFEHRSFPLSSCPESPFLAIYKS